MEQAALSACDNEIYEGGGVSSSTAPREQLELQRCSWPRTAQPTSLRCAARRTSTREIARSRLHPLQAVCLRAGVRCGASRSGLIAETDQPLHAASQICVAELPFLGQTAARAVRDAHVLLH